MTEAETPRLDPAPETASPPNEVMPPPDEAVNGPLPEGVTARPPLNVEVVVADLGLTLPDDPTECSEVLLGALLESRTEAGEYLAMMQRVAADFENYRKRVERDQADTVLRISQRVVEHLLPALDSFDAAIAYEPQSPAEDKILDGMRGTHAQLMNILEAEGLSPVPAVGEPFDPAVHEAAVGPRGEGDGPLVVTHELRRGYVMRGRVVRPSLVTVEHG